MVDRRRIPGWRSVVRIMLCLFAFWSFMAPELRAKEPSAVVLFNLRMFDGISSQLRDDRIIVVQHDRIQRIAACDALNDFPDASRVDLHGLTVLPGLIDSHVHLTVPFMYRANIHLLHQMDRQIKLNFKDCVDSGVTTVRDLGGFPGKILSYASLSERNLIPGPRVVSSLSPIAARNGGVLGAPEQAPYFTNGLLKLVMGGNYAERPRNKEEVAQACEAMAKLGARWLKTLYQERSFDHDLPNLTDDEYRTILQIGKKHGLRCALHAPEVNGFIKGVTLGFDTLEHMPSDSIIPNDWVAAFIRKKMAIIPTMTAHSDFLTINKQIEGLAASDRSHLTPESLRQSAELLEFQAKQGKNKEVAAYLKNRWSNFIINFMKLYRAGATIGIGTDSGGTYSGFFGRYSDELEMYSSLGVPNDEILWMATSVNARILGMEDEIGSISEGKLADLIAVRGNPLEDIRVLRRPVFIMKGGVIIKDGLQINRQSIYRFLSPP